MKHNCITNLRTSKWSTPPGYINHGVLDKIHNDYGYWHDGGYFFYVKDYRGDVRVVLNQSNQPVELNSYYPYGGLMGATTSEGTQPYKYSAKELDRENGIDLYDSNARWYDSMLGRTTTPDPLAEKYYNMSPYMWCAGNPVNCVDPNGKWVVGIGKRHVYYDSNSRKWRNASRDIMRLGNEMAKTKTGLKTLQRMLEVDYPITLIFDELHLKKEGRGVLLGITKPILVRENNGKKRFKSVTITIYTKAIEDEEYRDKKHIGLSESEILGAVGVHEGTHGTEKKASSGFVDKESAEKRAQSVEMQHLEQLKTKKQEEETK